MSRQVQLSVTASVTLDPTGSGSVTIGPTGAGEVWPAGYCAGVYVSTNTREALCRVFAGGRFIGSTTWGSTGDATSDTPQMTAGQVIEARWTGGDPGATAVLDVTGTRETG